MNVPSPCYVLDEKKFIRNLKIINRVQQEAGIVIIIAFKGFAMWSVFPMMRKFIKVAAVSSLNEVKLCADEMGVKSHTYCSAYRPEEFDEVVHHTSHLTFNSLSSMNDSYREFPIVSVWD